MGHAQVLKRNTLLQLVCGMPGQASFPRDLVKVLTNRIIKWILPIYGYSEDEELARVPPDQLEGAVVICPSLLRAGGRGGAAWRTPACGGQPLFM